MENKVENLQENLISGIVSAEGGASGQSADPGGGSAPEHECVGDPVSTLVERALDVLADKFREAEESGFRRGLEEVRRNPQKYGVLQSVPNFLADLRSDFWE